MNVLVTDTATEACSAALCCNGETLSKFEIAPRMHNQLLFTMCKELFADAGITSSQLDVIAFGRGPGTFTGVRIAAMFTQGIAFVHDLPVVAISDLCALAQAAFKQCDATRVLATLDARMGEIYYGYFHRSDESFAKIDGDEAVAAPNSPALTDLAHSGGVVCGNGLTAYPELAQAGNFTALDTILLPDAKAMLSIALHEIDAGHVCPVEEAIPVYLRHPVTNSPAKRLGKA